MIYIILQEEEDSILGFAAAMKSVNSKVRTVPSCGEYELQFVFDNFKEHNTLTIIGIHPAYKEIDAIKWAGKFEKSFNIPVFIGKVWGIWR